MNQSSFSSETGHLSTLEEDKRACDTCRRRKVKCELTTDNVTNITVCESCLKRGEQCTFLEKPKPRGRRRKQPLVTSSAPSEPSKNYFQSPIFDFSEPLPANKTNTESPIIARASITLQDILDPPFDPSIRRYTEPENYFNNSK